MLVLNKSILNLHKRSVETIHEIQNVSKSIETSENQIASQTTQGTKTKTKPMHLLKGF